MAVTFEGGGGRRCHIRLNPNSVRPPNSVGAITKIAADRPRTLASWPSSPGESTRSGLSAISNPIKKDQPDGRQLKKECFSRRLSALASRSLAHLWPVYRCCCRAKRARLVAGIMLQPPGACQARGRRSPHMIAPTLLTRVVCAECSCGRRSSLWRSCVEVFAAGACHDRRWHMVQRMVERDGNVCCKSIETCIALFAVRTAQPCHWW